MRYLADILKNLHPRRKRQLENLHKQKTPRKKKAPNPAADLRPDVIIPPHHVLKQLLAWEANPRSFLEISPKSQPESSHIFVQIYLLLRQIERTQIVNQIRRRILVLIVHGLEKRFCSSLFVGSAKRPHFLNFLIQSGLVDENEASEELT